MWSGTISSIPYGWALCNGNNGTPDLRDKFLTGAGGKYNVGDTGGSEAPPEVTVAPHALTIAELPAHGHSYASPAGGGVRVHYGDEQTTQGSSTATTGTVGSGAAHAHTTTVTIEDTLPPYFALCFIMKL